MVPMLALAAIASLVTSAIGAKNAYNQIDNTSQYNKSILQNQASALKTTTASKISDRMKQANAELGTLRSITSLSSPMLNKMTSELGYVAGLDISRLGLNQEKALLDLQQKRQQLTRETKLQKQSIITGALNSASSTALRILSLPS